MVPQQRQHQDHPSIFTPRSWRVVGVLFVVSFAVLGEDLVPDDKENRVQRIFKEGKLIYII